MRRVCLVLIVGIGIAIPATALAKPSRAAAIPIVSCHLTRGLIPGVQTDADHIRIQEPDVKIDNYLPRCDLASFVVESSATETRFVLKGARWFVGPFTCTYRNEAVRGRDEVRIATECVHHGQYPTTVWFNTYG